MKPSGKILQPPPPRPRTKNLEKRVELILWIGGKNGLECPVSNILFSHPDFEEIRDLLELIKGVDVDIRSIHCEANTSVLTVYLKRLKDFVCPEQCKIIHSALVRFFQNELDKMPLHHTPTNDLGSAAYQQERLDIQCHLALFKQALIECDLTDFNHEILRINEKPIYTEHDINSRHKLPSNISQFRQNIINNGECFNLWKHYFTHYTHVEIRDYFNSLLPIISRHPDKNHITRDVSLFIEDFRKISANRNIFSLNIMLDFCTASPRPPQRLRNINILPEIPEETEGEEMEEDNNTPLIAPPIAPPATRPVVSVMIAESPNIFATHRNEMATYLAKVIYHSQGAVDEYQSAVIIFKDYITDKIHTYNKREDKLRLVRAAEKQIIEALSPAPTNKLSLLKRYLDILEERLFYDVPRALSSEFESLVIRYTKDDATAQQKDKLYFLRALLREANFNPEKSYQDCVASTLRITFPDTHENRMKANKGLWGQGFFGQHRTHNFIKHLLTLDEREQAPYNQGL